MKNSPPQNHPSFVAGRFFQSLNKPSFSKRLSTARSVFRLMHLEKKRLSSSNFPLPSQLSPMAGSRREENSPAITATVKCSGLSPDSLIPRTGNFQCGGTPSVKFSVFNITPFSVFVLSILANFLKIAKSARKEKVYFSNIFLSYNLRLCLTLPGIFFYTKKELHQMVEL